MQALQIIANSWPLAVMFVAVCGAFVIVYLIRSFRQADREDKAYRASQAVAVTRRDDY